MNHGEAWLIAGRDAMWFFIATAPAGMMSTGKPDYAAPGMFLYVVVMVLCYCAGAGYIRLRTKRKSLGRTRPKH